MICNNSYNFILKSNDNKRLYIKVSKFDTEEYVYLLLIEVK